jgi:hypothetical protein
VLLVSPVFLMLLVFAGVAANVEGDATMQCVGWGGSVRVLVESVGRSLQLCEGPANAAEVLLAVG